MFKIGDKLKCIKPFGGGYLSFVGGTYTIEEMHFNNNDNQYKFKLENVGNNRFFPSDCFELIEKVKTNFEKNIEVIFHNFKENDYEKTLSLPVYMIDATEILKPINKMFEGKMWTSLNKFPVYTIKEIYIYSIYVYSNRKTYCITYKSSSNAYPVNFDLSEKQHFFKSREEAQKYIDNIQ